MNSSKNSMYIFLKGATVEGLKSFRWPLWFHASMVGSISLDLSVYYEMENPSDEMGFRTLRMHYSLEVLPSLDVSFQIIRSPSRLDEFLVRMDVVNNSRTDSFWLHQVSVVGDHFYLSSHILEDEKKHGSPNSSHVDKIDIGQHKSICPGQMLPDGQKASHLFKIIVCTLIFAVNVFIIDNMCPISWLMEGPHTVIHDFAKSFCEMRFQVTVQNSSDAVAFIRLVMFNQAENEVQLSDVGQLSGASEEGGWHEISLGNSGKVLSDLLAQSSPSRKQSSKSISSYVWTGSSSTKVKLEPLSSAVIPLNLCIFAPGVYDLSNYELQWDIKPCNEGNDGFRRDSSKRTAGTSLGHPFYLTALQSA
ncbi:hypothetical protein EJ110_NYTH54143 [Nymphaea thermarum]|nr:hypothetical protein EJ110_NYTH54143 [Nymphaea thermarum]